MIESHTDFAFKAWLYANREFQPNVRCPGGDASRRCESGIEVNRKADGKNG